MKQEPMVYNNEPIVLPDECGDSLWDAVLQQEANATTLTAVSKPAPNLLNSVDAVQVSDTTNAAQGL